MRAWTVAMSAVIASTRASIWVSRNAWCSVNRPVSASLSRAVVERIDPLASSASTAGSRSPAISAASIARPETPNRSLTTTDSLISASSSSFSTRCFSAVRTASKSTRYRVRSRSSRIAGGGTKRGRSIALLGDLAQPHRVQPVGLGPAGQVLDVMSVDQPRLEPVLQQIERRPPVVARRLHHHPGHPQGGQPVGQPEQRGGHRGNRAHLLHALPRGPATRAERTTSAL